MSSSPQNPISGRSGRPYGLAGCAPWMALAAVAVTLAVFFAWWRPWSIEGPGGSAGLSSPDPRLTYETRFRNVRPDVAYVGDARCAECHVEAITYPTHPMGRSFMPMNLAMNSERYDEAVHNPFERSGTQFRVEHRDGRIVHTARRLTADGAELYHVENPIAYALGSGTHGRSYIVAHDGFLFHSPISWYTQVKRWGLAPELPADRLFDRPMVAQCLFCHCNDARLIPGTMNRYEQPFQAHAIGCERCHGPAELHIKERQFGQKLELPDDTIVNPGRLPAELRDSVCEQCHLQGEARVVRRGRDMFDFRPGLPLRLFFSIFVRPAERTNSFKVVGHVEQMRYSLCYRQSMGRLSCTSCHDPHQLPAADKRIAYYRDRCLACHGEARSAPPPPSACKEGGDEDCLRCHMPRLPKTEIPHTATTDHRILRPDKARTGTPGTTRPSGPREMPWVYYHADQADPRDPEVTRDLGIALVEQSFKKDARAASQLADLALPRLKEAVLRDPADAIAWEALGVAYGYQWHHREALDAFEAALARVPNQELALVGAGENALALDQLEAAQSWCERAVAAYPWVSGYHVRLAQVLSRREDWPRAREECQAALRINPALFEVHKLLILSLLHEHSLAEAEKEYRWALKTFPEQGPELHRVWEAQRR